MPLRAVVITVIHCPKYFVNKAINNLHIFHKIIIDYARGDICIVFIHKLQLEIITSELSEVLSLLLKVSCDFYKLNQT